MLTKDIHNMRGKISNYFQRVLSGRMEKGDWIILAILFGVFSSIFGLSWWKGGPVGGFTFILAVVTIWNITITQGLLKQSKEAGLFNYATNYLVSFSKGLEKDKSRGFYTRKIRRIIYDALEDLLSPETTKKIKEFRSIVDAQWTEEISKEKTINQNLKK